MTDDIVHPLKRCTKCGVEYPATTQYFHRNKRGKYGLNVICVICNRAKAREWNSKNAERSRKREREWRIANRERKRQTDREWYDANTEKKREYDRQRYIANRDTHRESCRIWYVKNSEAARRKSKARYWQNPEREKALAREWVLRNPEKARLSKREYRQQNFEKIRIYIHRREARKRSLADTFTHEQWQHALEYFGGCCAVCGRPVKDLFNSHTLSADHWIPLSSPDCPGTVATNVLPLCHSKEIGAGGCNGSKSNKDPEKWLVERFGDKKSAEILKRIQEYFDSIK